MDKKEVDRQTEGESVSHPEADSSRALLRVCIGYI